MDQKLKKLQKNTKKWKKFLIYLDIYYNINLSLGKIYKKTSCKKDIYVIYFKSTKKILDL